MTYGLAERFVSINGEGARAGQLAVFLRFPGCNLRCGYCDTAWANENACPTESLTLQEILDYVAGQRVSCVTVTGGEPLLQRGMLPLLEGLSSLPGISVEVETNGSVPLEGFQVPRVSMTMDYKLPDSGMEGEMHLPNLDSLRAVDTLKFVCSSRRDMLRGKDLLEAHPNLEQVPTFFSPVFGWIEPSEMVAFLQEFQLKHVRLQLQLHKIIWSPDEKGV